MLRLKEIGVGEMVQQLKALAELPEDLKHPHGYSQLPVRAALEDLIPPHTCADKTPMHMK